MADGADAAFPPWRSRSWRTSSTKRASRQLSEAVNGEPGARCDTLAAASLQQGKLPEAIVQLREFLAKGIASNRGAGGARACRPVLRGAGPIRGSRRGSSSKFCR